MTHGSISVFFFGVYPVSLGHFLVGAIWTGLVLRSGQPGLTPPASSASDWMVEAGQTPEGLRTLADAIPCACRQPTFDAAMSRAEYQLAVENPEADCEQDLPASARSMTAYQPGSTPVRIPEHILERRQSTDPDDRITSDALGYRGLPVRYHSDYRFGGLRRDLRPGQHSRGGLVLGGCQGGYHGDDHRT